MATLDDAILFEMLYRFRIQIPLTALRHIFDVPHQRHFCFDWLHHGYGYVHRRITKQIRIVRKCILCYLDITDAVILPGETVSWSLTFSQKTLHYLQSLPYFEMILTIGQRIMTIKKAICKVHSFLTHHPIHTVLAYRDDDSLDDSGPPSVSLVFFRRAFLPCLGMWHDTLNQVLDMESLKLTYNNSTVQLDYVRLQYFNYIFSDIYHAHLPTRLEQMDYSHLHKKLSYKCLIRKNVIPQQHKIDGLFYPILSIPLFAFEIVIPPEFNEYYMQFAFP